jgi:tetratricopeptide (TPR) repeat protein
MRMRLRSLRFHDLALFHNARDYSKDMRSALYDAYSALHTGPHDPGIYNQAAAAVMPILDQPMATRQRIRIYFVLGMAFAAVNNYSEALTWLDVAVDLARDLLNDEEDQLGAGDLLDLLYLRGAVHRSLLSYSAMAADYREYLALIQQQRQSPDALEAPLTLEVLVQLGGAEFFLAHYDEAQQLLGNARYLLPAITRLGPTTETRLVEGTLEWFQSQLDRWRGMPDLALGAATRAAGVYREFGSPISAARAQLIVAEIQLDLATQQTTVGARRLHAGAARPQITEGLRLAAEAGDPVGTALLEFAETRWSRLEGREADRLGSIDHLVQLGRHLDDKGILAQAYTALGDELMFQGDAENAIYRYRDVRAMLHGSDIPALGVWARRALHKIEVTEPDLG